jgi:SAM-dependent methyltransferase
VSDEDVAHHFDGVATEYHRWKEKASYYYDFLKSLVAEVIPADSEVCEVGCGTGDILASLRPRRGTGLDVSPEMVRIAREKHPELRFELHDILRGPFKERFDYVLAVDVMEHVDPPEDAMESMASMLAPGGRLVVTTANPRWSTVLELAEKLRLKMPEGRHTWRALEELASIGQQAGLSLAASERSFLIPKRIPVLHRLNRASWCRPVCNRLGLVQRLVFDRP